MQKEVSETSRQTMKEHLESDVYSQYSPTQYVRKYSDGGLLDDSNIETKMIDNNTLRIENIRKDEDTGRMVDKIIEFGKGYWNNYLDELIGARPFIYNSFLELKSGKAKEALIRGLKRQGIDCK